MYEKPHDPLVINATPYSAALDNEMSTYRSNVPPAVELVMMNPVIKASIALESP
jgi:hypothetical protein